VDALHNLEFAFEGAGVENASDLFASSIGLPSPLQAYLRAAIVSVRRISPLISMGNAGAIIHLGRPS